MFSLFSEHNFEHNRKIVNEGKNASGMWTFCGSVLKVTLPRQAWGPWKKSM